MPTKLVARFYSFVKSLDGKNTPVLVNRIEESAGMRYPVMLAGVKEADIQSHPLYKQAQAKALAYAKAHGIDAPIIREPFPSMKTAGLVWCDLQFSGVDLGTIGE